MRSSLIPFASSTCGEAWSIGTLLLLVLGGAVIGLLGKFVAPGDKDNIPLALTVLCGIAGVLLGNYLYVTFGGSCATSGIDWVRHLVQIVTAAVLVVIASTVTGRNAGSSAG